MLRTELHNQIVRTVDRLDFAPLLAPQAHQGRFIIALAIFAARRRDASRVSNFAAARRPSRTRKKWIARAQSKMDETA